jgi:protein phosphatase
MKPVLAVLVGISGSGKSTYATGLKTSLTVENKLPTELVQTDAIRLELTGNAEDQTQNNRVFSTARTRVANHLSQDKNCIIDATSLNRKDRKEWVQIGKAKGAEVRAYFVNISIATAKARNAKRDRKVPDYIIDKQLSKLSPPVEDEGFDRVVNI